MNITAPEQWQAERLQGIGASEASAVIGKNPWMSNVDLWLSLIHISEPTRP